ncbi:hypothetical protein A6R70_01015 [Agrobacterium rubi]|uniref:pyridoxamine 5'-phosphate oxidase family protein n=1 Tax=Agrobacterium rubi TaxID=28099 RepID=UPI00201B75FA|nr:pyridoxamine 5'-phosphate oxidase family protein [Agrobacterium rubi]MCL6650867.1 hypothetical protein [Agrobacterium rubi]
MNVQEMTTPECRAMLEANSMCYLGCIAAGKPYIVPLQYLYHGGMIYAFSMQGKKIESLRMDPHVCLQLDHVETKQEWQSVLVEGRYQELPDDEKWHGEHMYAWSLLQEKNDWWEPGAYKPAGIEPPKPASLPVFFSVEIETLSGRRARND